jgi:hypothetical protein
MTHDEERAALSQDEISLIDLYRRVLSKFRPVEIYASNYRLFNRWSPYQRLKWIYYLEVQAQQGLPLAVALVSEAITLRIAE